MINSPLTSLIIVMIRHGEKPGNGDNLSPQGLSRALQLPTVLYSKFGIPNHVYVPALVTDITTAHSRMFQTVTPFAIQYNLSINSKFNEKDFAGIASHVLGKTGTALLVWEHHGINNLALAFGINDAPVWEDDDFDSIWIITFNQAGEPTLRMDKQTITP